MLLAIRTAFTVLLLVGVCGCQCSRLYNRYPDVIDDISDCPPHVDKWYHPCFDLNRIGKRDWCSCWFNRLWCRCGCERPMSLGYPVPEDFVTEGPIALGVASNRALKQVPTDVQSEAAAAEQMAPPAPAPPAGTGAPPAATPPEVPAL